MGDFETNIVNKLKEFFYDLEKTQKKANRVKDKIRVLFATKYLNREQLASFIGLYYQIRGEKVLIGENKVQDASQKIKFIKEYRSDLVNKYYRVMIGNLQKNKINKVLDLFDEIWGVDSTQTAVLINSRLDTSLPARVPIFLEINISGEATKHGISKANAEKAIKEINSLPNLNLKGLMTMAPDTKDRELIKKVFEELKQIAQSHKLLTSMGMSGDWKEAVWAGSDILRIGSRIFG